MKSKFTFWIRIISIPRSFLIVPNYFFLFNLLTRYIRVPLLQGCIYFPLTYIAYIAFQKLLLTKKIIILKIYVDKVQLSNGLLITDSESALKSSFFSCRNFFKPLGLSFGIKDSKHLKPSTNEVLEMEYHSLEKSREYECDFKQVSLLCILSWFK